MASRDQSVNEPLIAALFTDRLDPARAVGKQREPERAGPHNRVTRYWPAHQAGAKLDHSVHPRPNFHSIESRAAQTQGRKPISFTFRIWEVHHDNLLRFRNFSV